MLDLDHLKNFLVDRGARKIPFAYNRLPSEPDEITVMTDTPAPNRLSVERSFETAGIQIRCRSDRRSARRARDNIEILDRIMMDDEARPFYIGGLLVIDAGRQGGAPSYLTTDHQNRVSYVCNYWLTIQR